MTLGLIYQVDEHIKYIHYSDTSTSCYRAHQEGTGKSHGKIPWDNQHQWTTKNKWHAKEGFALKANKFISSVVPYGNGLDPALQENTAHSICIVIIIIILLLLIIIINYNNNYYSLSLLLLLLLLLILFNLKFISFPFLCKIKLLSHIK